MSTQSSQHMIASHRESAQAIPFHYQGQSVRFSSEGWINATEIARCEGRRLDKWLATQETQDYIAALMHHLNTPEKGDLIRSVRGRGGGTWLHPKLAVAFARWISPDFAVWCDLHIDALLRGELTERQRFDQACKRLNDGKQQASQNGRGLALWKQQKLPLEREVKHWREQLQMILELES